MIYSVTFDRIGRNCRNAKENFEANTADDLAEAIFKYSKKHLGSKEFDVLVDLDTMTGSIEYGRFGEFTIAPVAVPVV